MPNFAYTAKTSDGQRVVGQLQADTEAAAARALAEKSLYPVEISEKAATLKSAAAAGNGRIRQRDVGVMYGQLADLLRAGVPLLRALETLERAMPRPAIRAALREVRGKVAEGTALAEALAEHPKAFRPLHIAMVRAGERAGFLDSALDNLSMFIDRQDELQSKIRGSLMYPAVLTFVGVAAMLFILIGLVPQFRTVFEGMPQPAPTRALFATSNALVEHWAVSLIVLVVLGVAAAVAVRSPSGRQVWERLRLKVPVLGNVWRALAITRFCRVLGTMLANGVPILQSLAISKDASGNRLLADCVEEAAESVRAGESLSEPLSRGGLFPAEVVEMIAVAEEANQLQRVLVEIADTIERRTNRLVDQAVRLIEPLLLVMIAGVIGFVAMGLLMPIFGMASNLR